MGGTDPAMDKAGQLNNEVDGADMPSGHGQGRPTEDVCAGGGGRRAGDGCGRDKACRPERLRLRWLGQKTRPAGLK